MTPENTANKRVILVTGNGTKWYDQAIFIVNKRTDAASVPANMVEEAESIIESYLRGDRGARPSVEFGCAERDSTPACLPASAGAKKRRRSFGDTLLNILTAGCCAALACLLFVAFS